MRITRAKRITPVPSRCLTVGSQDHLYAAGGESGRSFYTHNSVVQRNVIVTCIMRGLGGAKAGQPDAGFGSWRFLGIDLKRVELSVYRKYSKVVLGIATELEDALTVLRFGQQTMMKRYAEMEELGVNNFMDLPEKGQRLLIMCDEAGELLDQSGKALAASTPIPTVHYENGDFTTPIIEYKALEGVEVGDVVLNSENTPSPVFSKYEPTKQDHYELTVSTDETGEFEGFTAGAEHVWVAVIENPDGSRCEPIEVTTEELYDLMEAEGRKPEGERRKVKFRKTV